MSAFTPAPTASVPATDTGKTIEALTQEEGHYYDILGRAILVNRCTITYTDGTSTTLDLAAGIRYSSTGYISGPAATSPMAYIQAIEANNHVHD